MPRHSQRVAGFSLANSNRAPSGALFYGANMTDETTPARGDYSSREAFLEDLAVARELGQLRNASLFWDTLDGILAENTELRATVESFETRVAALEATLSSGT